MDPLVNMMYSLFIFIAACYLAEIGFKHIYRLNLRNRKNGFKVLQEGIRQVIKIISPPRAPTRRFEESRIHFNPIMNSTAIPDESCVTSAKRYHCHKSKRIADKKSEKEYPSSPWAKVSAKTIGKAPKKTAGATRKVSNAKK